ncbi:hypothetical protein LCGC14_1436970 [marine sediment metagenome]|uniref:Uncharacterized protein n=1 Tax=marine sediment metagenome TaxID=412755 RepID=A0A0F9MNS2_9ZZZZ
MDKNVAFSLLVIRIKLMELKLAQEALSKAIREDAVIADNMRSVWLEQNCQAEPFGG